MTFVRAVALVGCDVDDLWPVPWPLPHQHLFSLCFSTYVSPSPVPHPLLPPGKSRQWDYWLQGPSSHSQSQGHLWHRASRHDILWVSPFHLLHPGKTKKAQPWRGNLNRKLLVSFWLTNDVLLWLKMIDIATIWPSRHDVTDLCLYIFILIFFWTRCGFHKNETQAVLPQIRQCTCLKMFEQPCLALLFFNLEMWTV